VSLTDQLPKAIPAPRKITTEPRFTDKVFRGVVTSGGLFAGLLLGLIGFFLVFNGFEAMRAAGLSFITGFDWVDAIPEEGQPASYGIGAMLYGTLVTGILAMIMGVPVAVGTALFLSYYAPQWIKKPMVVVVDVMAAIPSIVYGLWGYFVLMPHAEYWAKLIHKYFGFIPFFDMPAPVFTRSPFIAGLVLAIMIIPIVTAVSREVFAQTPLERIQAAYALGATKWSMIPHTEWSSAPNDSHPVVWCDGSRRYIVAESPCRFVQRKTRGPSHRRARHQGRVVRMFHRCPPLRQALRRLVALRLACLAIPVWVGEWCTAIHFSGSG